MNTSDFTITLLVDQDPKQAFNAISNVSGWWSEDIEGNTENLNDEFKYHYEDVHYCQLKIIEIIPDKKVVWLVLDNHFNFTKDKSEWKGTKICFEISEKNDKTLIRFTHLGLVPEYECFDICSNAWTDYLKNSLKNLITTGKGQPNTKGGRNTYQEGLSKKMEGQNYHTVISTNATANEAFKSINNVTKWWTENLEGNSQQLNDEFSVRFGDVHYSRQKLVEVIPDRKIVWLVTDSNLGWLRDKNEWTNTKISFEIFNKDNKTQVLFTHIGLVPKIECYNDCSSAWSQFIHKSLLTLISTGKGRPDLTEGKAKAARKRSVHTSH
jgi:hypothetical protein